MPLAGSAATSYIFATVVVMPAKAGCLATSLTLAPSSMTFLPSLREFRYCWPVRMGFTSHSTEPRFAVRAWLRPCRNRLKKTDCRTAVGSSGAEGGATDLRSERLLTCQHHHAARLGWPLHYCRRSTSAHGPEREPKGGSDFRSKRHSSDSLACAGVSS